MKTCYICPGTAPSPCRPPHASSPVTGTSWLFSLPSATLSHFIGYKRLIFKCYLKLKVDDERRRMGSAAPDFDKLTRTEGRLKQIQNQYLQYIAVGFIEPHQFMMHLEAEAEDS